MGASSDASKRVLIVEDEADLREVMAQALTRAGYRVQTAQDGQRALEQVARHMPDLILLDMRMPGMDGREFARRFRAEHGERVPIVVCTAAVEARQAARELGAQGYLDKPFRVRRLLEVVRRHLGGSD